MIRLANGITVSAIQRKTNADLKKPIRYDLTLVAAVDQKRRRTASEKPH